MEYQLRRQQYNITRQFQEINVALYTVGYQPVIKFFYRKSFGKFYNLLVTSQMNFKK